MEDKNDRVLVYIPEVGGIHQEEQSWRAEVFGVNRVVSFCQQIKKDEVISHKVVLMQEHPIIGQKPAVIKLYDYYEPSTFNKGRFLSQLCPKITSPQFP